MATESSASNTSSSVPVLKKGTKEEYDLLLQSFPRQSHSTVTNHANINTDIAITFYDNKYLIMITQLNKFGTVIEVIPEIISDSDKPLYHVKTLLGKRDDVLLDVYARQIIQYICKNCPVRPIVLTIALHDDGRDKETFDSVLNKVKEILSA